MIARHGIVARKTPATRGFDLDVIFSNTATTFRPPTLACVPA